MSALASVWNKYQENRDLIDAFKRQTDGPNYGITFAMYRQARTQAEQYERARYTQEGTASHQAIADLKASGKHAIQMQAVLTTLRRMTSENNLAVTSAELAHHMEVDRHLAGRRLPDLANRGLAKKIGKATCSVNGTRAVTWSAT